MARHKAGDYLSPHLVQAVAREEPDPISRHIDGWRDYYHTTTALWTMNTASLLRGQSIDRQANNSLWEQLTEAVPETDIEIRSTREATLRQTQSDAAQYLAESSLAGGEEYNGMFLDQHRVIYTKDRDRLAEEIRSLLQQNRSSLVRRTGRVIVVEVRNVGSSGCRVAMDRLQSLPGRMCRWPRKHSQERVF
ncbi:MAG: hypothetical protein R3C02_02780 [Planctomycetaceae bacterium]